jgi:putative tryptophan/tyrosine transport system substrate-binding protein
MQFDQLKRREFIALLAVPIVFTTGDDPIKLGLVASLNRPGGNATGVSNLLVELGSKQLGLLRELAPGTTTIAVLTNPNFPGTERQLRDLSCSLRRHPNHTLSPIAFFCLDSL